jgi:hypothetical protein
MAYIASPFTICFPSEGSPMFKSFRRLMIAGAAAVAVGAPAAVMVAQAPAQADTVACAQSVTTHNGNTNNWCGSQLIPSLNLEISTPNKVAQYARVTVKAAGENKQTDFQWFPPSVPTPNNGKIAAWSPRGVNSNLCLDIANNHAVPVLKTCVNTKVSQHWDAVQIGSGTTFEWVNEATGTAITLPSGGGQYTRLTLAAPVGAIGQGFTFTQ